MVDEDEVILCSKSTIPDIISCFFTTSCLLISIITTYKFCKSYKSHNDKINNTTIVIAVILIISGFIVMTTIDIGFLNCSIGIHTDRSLYNILFGGPGIFNVISIQSMFILRLYMVFKGTSYAYSNKTFFILVLILIFIVIFAFTGMVLSALYILTPSMIFVVSTFFLYIGLSLVTVWLFVHGLHKVKNFLIF